MDSQPQQRFCVNCGQPLTPGAAFCATCGTQMSTLPAGAQAQFPVDAQQVYQQPYTQPPMQAQDDPLLTGLASPDLHVCGRWNGRDIPDLGSYSDACNQAQTRSIVGWLRRGLS